MFIIFYLHWRIKLIDSIYQIEDDYMQDPGISTVPLEQQQKEESKVRSNTASLNLLAFRSL